MSHILRRLCTTTTTNRSFISTYFFHQRIRNLSVSSDVKTNTDVDQQQLSCPQQPSSYNEQQFFKGIGPACTFAHIGEVVGPSVVDLSLDEGYYGFGDDTSGGSGFFVNEDTILTCAHVVINEDWLCDEAYAYSEKEVQVTLHDGTSKLTAVVSKVEMDYDLALLKITLADAEKYSYSLAKLGISNQVRQGDLVCALGSPFGYLNTLTAGVISNVNRKDFELDMKDMGRRFLQTDCAINLGSSGGPLVNMSGEVIGVVNRVGHKNYQGTRIQGIAIVIPIDTVAELGLLEEAGSVGKEEAVPGVAAS